MLRRSIQNSPVHKTLVAQRVGLGSQKKPHNIEGGPGETKKETHALRCRGQACRAKTSAHKRRDAESKHRELRQAYTAL